MPNSLEKRFLLEVEKRKHKRRNDLFKTILNFIKYSRINFKSVQTKHIFGLTILFLVLAYQYSPIAKPINTLVTKLVYKPAPPTSPSPWSWKDSDRLHPLIANMNQETETSIKAVANYIAENESDPYLRVKAIHDYVINRIDYDLNVLTTGTRPSQDPQAVFKTRKAVCEGYAKLFQALGRAMGIETVYITGRIRQELAPVELIPGYLRIGRSKYNWTLHAWNAVKIEDNWYLVDPTWDDNKQNKYSSEYLMLPPEAMIVSHFPDLSVWQLLPKAKNYKSFENSPIMQPKFFAQSLTLVSPQQYETESDRLGVINIKTPDNYQQNIVAFSQPISQENFDFGNLFKPKQSTSKRQQDIEWCHSQNNSQGTIEISCEFSQSGQHKIFIFSEEFVFGRENSLTPLGELKFKLQTHSR